MVWLLLLLLLPLLLSLLLLLLLLSVCKVANGGAVKLGSTHGRPLVTVATLSGDKPPPEAPRGQCEVGEEIDRAIDRSISTQHATYAYQNPPST